MNKTLIEKRCGSCGWLMFKATAGTTRIEHKCTKCKTINVVEGIEPDTKETPIRWGIIKRA